MGKQGIVIFILLILLVLSLGYIAVMKYKAREMGIYQAGASYGYQGAIVEIFQKASNCEQVPLYVENRTLNLFSVECLNKVQEEKSSK